MSDALASRVAQALSAAGATVLSRIAFPLAPGGRETADVDVFAVLERVRRHGAPVRSEVACVSASVQIDADEAGAILAVVDPSPPARCEVPVAGAPSRGVLEGDAFRLPPECVGDASRGLDVALAALDDGVPVARSVRRASDEASLDVLSPRVADAVRACAAREHAVTLDAHAPHRDTCLLRVEIPTLVVAARISTYAPSTGELRDVDAVAVPIDVETHRGRERRFVDVVSASAFEAWSERLVRVADRLAMLLESDQLARLERAAAAQRLAWRVSDRRR